MTLLGLLPFLLFAFLQAASLPLLQGDALNTAEKARLSSARKVDDRIKVYHSASKRMQQSVQTAVRSNDFPAVPGILKLWVSLLAGSLEDIDASFAAKKKSKALIRYEIQVRKALTEFKGYKVKAPAEQQDEFEAQLADAEKIRKRYMEIIFR